MLSLQHAYPGHPNGAFHNLILPGKSLILYPTADAIVILHAQSLALARVLAFWEVFPGVDGEISSLSVDSGMKLIVAAVGHRVATWSLSGVQNDVWRIHSSLVLPQIHEVRSLDTKSGLLAVGTSRGLSVYTLILENDLPTWSQKWMVSFKHTPSLLRFAPSLAYIAATTEADTAVRLYSTTTGRQIQSIPHPRPIINLSWRYSSASSRDDLILYTTTIDSTLRLFLPVLDSPQHLQLHGSIDLSSSISHSLVSSQQQYQSSRIFQLDRSALDQYLQKSVTPEKLDQEDASARRLRDIKDEDWDLFFRVLGDGSIILTAVTNVDRRPPTLLNHFTLHHTSSPCLPSSPSQLSVFASSKGSAELILVTSSPLASFEFSLAGFLDGNPSGLRLVARRLPRVSEEETKISHFLRTPEGRGLAVVREGSRGEVWSLDAQHLSLSRVKAWTSTKLVVVLDGGRNLATYAQEDSILTLHTEPPVQLKVPPLNSLFTLPSTTVHDAIIGIVDDLSIVHITVTSGGDSEGPLGLSLRSYSRLPVPATMMLPVDPMAWVHRDLWTEYDALLSISELGELAFWMLDAEGSKWKCTGNVKTGRKTTRKARCSSMKKTALVAITGEGEELTIWDSKESEFASGLEYHRIFSDTINDLDWTSTPDMQSILAVGFLQHVELICQQRMTYFDEGPGWTTCWRIEIGSFIPYSISDSIWLAGGNLLVGAGHQMFLYGSRHHEGDEESLFEYVARQNGPLPDYHPQMLLQCLLWDKVELVKEVIVNLSRAVENLNKSRTSWTPLTVERFLKNDREMAGSLHKKRYTALFDGPELKDDDEEGFGRTLVMGLIERLENNPLPHLTPNEHAHLLVLIQATLEIDEQRRALDANGLRYLISMRSFYILNRRASSPPSPESQGGIPQKSARRERLRYRDMIWGFFSESQELLLNASVAACNGKMSWSDARALGIPIWLSSIDSLKAQFESIARNEYMADDARDPTRCSLFYFALGKAKLVHGLWRQASWHKEQAQMLRFLSNDFTEPRWRTAALKNAFALLGKQRFEYAAAFFLLGNSLKDAVNVCVKQLNDFQLAVAIARIVEQSDEGPVLSSILNNTVVPTAFKEGNRWLASWAFWLLHRRDLSVRVLVSPLQDLVDVLAISVKDIGEPHYDDPSLALLFSQLRSKTLQTAKGNSEISGRLEFNFVLQIARVFCRMGCHVLALDLVKSWTFEHPAIHEKERAVEPAPPSPTVPRLFSMHRRRSSMMIDMEIPSLPPTRRASPERKPTPIPEEPLKNESDLFARKAGLGSLMQSAKQDVKVPEFDMNAFF
ncbi:regulator of (H+)-ATPase in vacuolar membrane [Marasmius tenuissimus]|nr:regulator of (H+)-ATPase in vacuolar membrane [Marasmius tenuissimus]